MQSVVRSGWALLFVLAVVRSASAQAAWPRYEESPYTMFAFAPDSVARFSLNYGTVVSSIQVRWTSLSLGSDVSPHHFFIDTTGRVWGRVVESNFWYAIRGSTEPGSLVVLCQDGLSWTARDLVLEKAITFVRSLCEYLGISRWNASYPQSAHRPGHFYTQVRVPPRPPLSNVVAAYRPESGDILFRIKALWVEANPDYAPDSYRFCIWSPDTGVNDVFEKEVGTITEFCPGLERNRFYPPGRYFIWAQARSSRAIHENGSKGWSRTSWLDLLQMVDCSQLSSSRRYLSWVNPRIPLPFLSAPSVRDLASGLEYRPGVWSAWPSAPLLSAELPVLTWLFHGSSTSAYEVRLSNYSNFVPNNSTNWAYDRQGNRCVIGRSRVAGGVVSVRSIPSSGPFGGWIRMYVAPGYTLGSFIGSTYIPPRLYRLEFVR